MELSIDKPVSQALGAWVLPIGHGASVAVGRFELKYIEYVATGVTLPGLPAYCERGFVWRDRFIPVLDLCSLIERRRAPVLEGEQMVAVIAYENMQNQLELGAILLQGVPKLLAINPEQSAAIEDLNATWQPLAHAAFSVDDQLYPVLDLRSLFGSSPAELLCLH